MNERTILWLGESGKEYKYWIHDMDTTFKDAPGNYIFAKETSLGNWVPIYVGQTDSLAKRLLNHEKLPCVEKHASTHIHAHTSSADDGVRRIEESDLIEKWKPSCNKE